MIPDAVVDEVRERADIVAIIGEIVPLKRAGKDYRALCPFHEERTPSFYVAPSKSLYKCFGCGAAGDVFSFVRQRLGLNFVGAVRYVAERSGVEVRERETRGRGEDPYRALYEINAFARDFYSRQLWESDAGEVARRYVQEREIQREVGERFRLGYAPAQWHALRDAATTHGIEEAPLLDVGLLKASERSQDAYDRFRDRLMFPIEDASGRVVAFGGRVIGPAEEGVPKYLNSPETVIYHKGSVLYGLSWAKVAMRREGTALLVEGYLDLVSLAARGIEHVVATLGTALTNEQARLLARYCRRANILYDNDGAGRRATFRAGDVLLAAGVHPAAVTLPSGDDPDSLVRREGPEAVRRYVTDAIDVLDRKLQILAERGLLDSSTGKWDSLKDRLLPTIRATKDPALRDIYVAAVAERTGVERETIRREALADQAAAELRARGPRGVVPARERLSIPKEKLGADRSFCLLLVKDRDWIDRGSERIHPEQLADPYCEVFRALLNDPELKVPLDGMSEEAAMAMSELLASHEILAKPERFFEDTVGRIHTRAINAKIHELDERMSSVPETEQTTLAKEITELRQMRAQLNPLTEDWSSTMRRLTHVTQPMARA